MVGMLQGTNKKVETKSVSIDGEYMVNVEIGRDGILRPRKSWKTFAGMVYQLWQLNKRYHRTGVKGDFVVSLPLPAGNFQASEKTERAEKRPTARTYRQSADVVRRSPLRRLRRLNTK